MTPTNTPTPSAAPDLGAVKRKQQVMWSSGDYAVVGATLQVVSEQLCETADLRPGDRVLDVATGNGGTAIAAARRYCDVTGVDYVPSLLVQARRRAEADGYTIDFQEGDAEALAHGDAYFDAVTSTFGVMFAADQRAAAGELARVTRPGGRIALANWSPDGFIGRLFKTIGAHNPPQAGVASPLLWGVESHIRQLFGDTITELRVIPRSYTFRYRSAEHFLDVFTTYYGPMLKAFEALDEAGQDALTVDLRALLASSSTDETMAIIPSAYAEVIATRA